jgi:hypothetical protein
VPCIVCWLPGGAGRVIRLLRGRSALRWQVMVCGVRRVNGQLFNGWHPTRRPLVRLRWPVVRREVGVLLVLHAAAHRVGIGRDGRRWQAAVGRVRIICRPIRPLIARLLAMIWRGAGQGNGGDVEPLRLRWPWWDAGRGMCGLLAGQERGHHWRLDAAPAIMQQRADRDGWVQSRRISVARQRPQRWLESLESGRKRQNRASRDSNR